MKIISICDIIAHYQFLVPHFKYAFNSLYVLRVNRGLNSIRLFHCFIFLPLSFQILLRVRSLWNISPLWKISSLRYLWQIRFFWLFSCTKVDMYRIKRAKSSLPPRSHWSLCRIQRFLKWVFIPVPQDNLGLNWQNFFLCPRITQG